MNDGNYIKINRSILSWEWFLDINTTHLFLYFLLKANWKEGKFKGEIIERGCFVSSLSKLAEETNLTVDEVRTAIKHLKLTKEITSKARSKYTVFTVLNYNKYQDVAEQVPSSSQANPEQVPSSSQPIPTLFPTIEERKEGKEEKKEEGNKENTLQESTEDSVRERVNYNRIVDSYNEICTSLPKCTKVTDARKRLIKARLNDYSEADLLSAFEKAEQSDFLSGRNGKWNGANIDWILNATNIQKVLEDNYKNKSGNNIYGYVDGWENS